MDFDFRPRAPAPPLHRLVESIWYARGQINYTRERIAPTGSSVAVFVLGSPIIQTPDDGRGEPFRAARGFLVGPHDRPVINEPTGETFAVGIVTKPIGCQACFSVPPASIKGRVVDLESAWPRAGALRENLIQADNPTAMLDIVEHALARHADSDVAGLDRCETAVALLEADPTRPIAEIAVELGIAHSHLDRELARIVGLSPRSLARLLRLRRLLALVDIRKPIDWADLAARFGWFDQSHFIRDFKRHTGISPSRYVKAQLETYSPTEIDDAAGFVPEP